MFLIGKISGNLILHWIFTYSSGYWFMAQNMENIDFRTFFTVTPQQCLYWSKTVIFEFLGTYLTRSIGYLVRSCFIFWKMHKIFKNEALGCSTPLNFTRIINLKSHWNNSQIPDTNQRFKFCYANEILTIPSHMPNDPHKNRTLVDFSPK